VGRSCVRECRGSPADARLNWYRTDSADDLLPAWARLGPLSTGGTRYGAGPHRRFGRDRVRRDRAPNGVAWRFPDVWTAVGFRWRGASSAPRRDPVAREPFGGAAVGPVPDPEPRIWRPSRAGAACVSAGVARRSCVAFRPHSPPRITRPTPPKPAGPGRGSPVGAAARGSRPLPAGWGALGPARRRVGGLSPRGATRHERRH
jgi:hypothetical protein